MLKKFDDETYQFSTGRFITPNCDVIGIDENGDLHEGYDNMMEPKLEDEDGTIDTDHENPELTPVEKHELAQYMISLWSKLLLQEPQY